MKALIAAALVTCTSASLASVLGEIAAQFQEVASFRGRTLDYDPDTDGKQATTSQLSARWAPCGQISSS